MLASAVPVKTMPHASIALVSHLHFGATVLLDILDYYVKQVNNNKYTLQLITLNLVAFVQIDRLIIQLMTS